MSLTVGNWIDFFLIKDSKDLSHDWSLDGNHISWDLLNWLCGFFEYFHFENLMENIQLPSIIKRSSRTLILKA